MINLRNISSLVILTILFSLISAQSQAISLFGNHMEDGKKNYATYKYEMAINDFTEELKKNPENAEAHLWIGMSYEKLNDRSNAIRNFKTAVALDAVYNQRINKAISQLNPTHIAEIESTLKEATRKNTAFKNELNNLYFTNGKKNTVAGNLRKAEQWFGLSISINPVQKQKISDIYYELGHYELALKHDPKHSDAQFALGKKHLQTAISEWPNNGYAYYEAIELLGEEVVNSNMPRIERKVILKGTYDCDSPETEDKVRCIMYPIQFGVDDIRDGDELFVIAKMKNGEEFTGTEIGILRCEECKKDRWYLTDKGYFNKTIEAVHEKIDGYLVVYTGSRKDVDVFIYTEREVKIVPKLNLLLIN